MDEKFINLYNDVKNILNGETISLVNISSLVINLMQSVEKINGLTGEEKKSLVIQVLKYTIEHSELPLAEKQILDKLCDILIPETINIIISAVKNEYDLNKIKSSCFSCFKCI
jgi:hypothetical protein